MNILHLSDLHYDGDNRVIDSVLPLIVDSINKSSKKVDFILFTGFV